MRLSLAASGATLTLTFAGATLARKWTVPWDGEAAAATARAIVGALARGNQARTLSEQNLADLRHHGEVLWRQLVPPELQRELGRGDTLTLELDEALVALPWELMFDGTAFLCRRLSIGRQVATGQARRGEERRAVGTPARVLVLAADPRGDLGEVRAEGEAIVDALDANAAVRTRLTTAPDRAFALRHFKDYDVVHFAGHADWVAERPGQSGWLLADGKLTADEIAALAGGRPMPMIVVSNACRSGETTAWSGGSDEVFGLANAFLTAGVRHYIGTQWEVVDGQSARFAAAFHRELGEGRAIGAAVRLARAAVVADTGEQALAWASYVLYGDPEARPLWRPEGKRKLSLPPAARLAARASAPWKRPAVTRSSAPKEDTSGEPGVGAGTGEAGGAGGRAADPTDRRSVAAAQQQTDRRSVERNEKQTDRRSVSRDEQQTDRRSVAAGKAAPGAPADGAGAPSEGPAPRRRLGWLPAALGGAAVGAFGVALIAWWATRKPPPVLKPSLSGVAVLSLAASSVPDDQQRARSFEWCLPTELAKYSIPVVPPEKLMTLQAQTNGAQDRASARQMGLAVGARWVVFGNVSAGTGHVYVSHVVDDLVLESDTFGLADVNAVCARFAAKVATRLAHEPPAP